MAGQPNLAGDEPALTREAVLDELAALATIEHALCVEHLLTQCALGHDLEPAAGEVGQRIADAAGAAARLAQRAMRPLHDLNSVLVAAGAPAEVGRAASIVVDGDVVALVPANPAAEPGFLARGHRVAAAVDARYAALAAGVAAAGNLFDDEVQQRLTFLLDLAPAHADAFTAVSEPLTGLAPTDYLRVTRYEAHGATEQRLLRLSDEYYDAVLTTVEVWFADEDELGGVLRGRSISLMEMLDEIDRLLVERGLMPHLRLPPPDEAGSGSTLA